MLDLVLFVAGGRSFTVEHALAAADFRDDLVPVREAVLEGLSCLRYAEDEGFELNPGDLDSAAESYRFDHDLTTAEEIERWLAVHALTVEDFSAWLERGAWRGRFSEDLAAIRGEYRCSDEEVGELLWPEVVFGDHLADFIRQLAARVATQLASGGLMAGADWPSELASMESVYRDKCRDLLSDANLERQLSLQGSSLLRADVEMASFASMDAAREAWSCASSEGEPLGDVAARAGGSLRRVCLFLDDLPERLRQPIWSAVPGQVLPPAESDAGAFVCRLCAKIAPSIADDQVRRRIESVLIERAAEDLIRAHVRWTEALAGRPH